MLKHPRALYILAFFELCDRFVFYGTSAILILYLIHIFKFSDVSAYSFCGAYMALAFILPIIGGILADRFIGFQKAIFYGAIAIIIGNLLLIHTSHFCLYLGLASSLFGIGLFKSNTTSLVGTLYENNNQRESAYTLFYMAMNIGAVLGPVVFGLIIKFFGWHITFGFNAILMLVGLILFLQQRRYFPLVKKNKSTNHFSLLIFFILLCVGLAMTTWIFIYPYIADQLVGIVAMSVLVSIIIYALKRSSTERSALFLFIFLCGLGTLFFAGELQVNISLNLFIDRYVDRNIFGFEIPTAAFTSLEPFFIILMAPLFSKLWLLLPSQFTVVPKALVSLVLASISFFIFALAASPMFFEQRYQLGGILLGNLCLGAGELMMVPAILATLSELAPKRLLGTLMGTWFISLALASSLGSLFAIFSSTGAHIKPAEIVYFHTFIMMGSMLLVLSFIAWMLSKQITVETTEKVAA